MQTFKLILKNEKQKSYRLIILFFVILNVIFFTCVFFDEALQKNGLIASVIIADVLLFLLSKIALQKTWLHFNTSSIEKGNIPVKKYTWDQFSNVVLKDNILTLDFKNNKLLQAEIDSSNINEDAFNTFAKQQLVNA